VVARASMRNCLFSLFVAATIILVSMSVVSVYGAVWDPEVNPDSINIKDLSEEGKAALLILMNASNEVTRVNDVGLRSSFKPAVFNILMNDASGKMDDATSAFNEREYNSTALLSMQAVESSREAEAALKAHHTTLLQAAVIIAGGVCALLIILPIGTYFYHKKRSRKEFMELQKKAARHEEERRALMSALASRHRVLPPGQT